MHSPGTCKGDSRRIPAQGAAPAFRSRPPNNRVLGFDASNA